MGAAPIKNTKEKRNCDTLQPQPSFSSLSPATDTAYLPHPSPLHTNGKSPYLKILPHQFVTQVRVSPIPQSSHPSPSHLPIIFFLFFHNDAFRYAYSPATMAATPHIRRTRSGKRTAPPQWPPPPPRQLPGRSCRPSPRPPPPLPARRGARPRSGRRGGLSGRHRCWGYPWGRPRQRP